MSRLSQVNYESACFPPCYETMIAIMHLIDVISKRMFVISCLKDGAGWLNFTELRPVRTKNRCW